ncbi:MAG: threonine synthase [Bacillota bacterium]
MSPTNSVNDLNSRKKWPGVIDAYRQFMPLVSGAEVISLQEGNTPLLYVPKLAAKFDLDIDLYLKYEGVNPTGSFKDRGMTLAVSQAVAEESKAIICASTGNTSAAAAAYGARAGVKAIVVVPEGKIALGKLAQAAIHGAKIIQVKGNFDQALELVKELTEEYPVTLVNSLNPYRIEGQKSAAFEVVDQLGAAPDILAIPVGNAGNITAYWQGFQEYHQAGYAESVPEMWGFEAEGSAAITYDKIITEPETLATAIRIGNPASWEKAVRAAQESQGLITSVTDDEILKAYKAIAATAGVFAEPASAASVAGVIKQAESGQLPSGSKVVAVLTGHGLKDPELALSEVSPPEAVEPELEIVLKEAGIKT